MKKQDKYLLAGIAGIGAAVLLAKNPGIVSGIFGGSDRAKTAFDSTIVKSVSAAVLLFEGKNAGRVVSVYGNTGNCTTTVHIWIGPMQDKDSKMKTTFRAGGFGYDKQASNLEQYARQFKSAETPRRFGSMGLDAFRDYGYEVIKAI